MRAVSVSRPCTVLRDWWIVCVGQLQAGGDVLPTLCFKGRSASGRGGCLRGEGPGYCKPGAPTLLLAM